MRRFAIVLLLTPCAAMAQPGPYWAYGFGGIADDRFTAIAHGPGDTLYACGTFSGVLTYYGGQVISQGVTDVMLVKMDTAGVVHWVRTAGGPGTDRATDLTVDASGNIVVTGQFSGSMTAGGVGLTSNGPSQDIFTVKWNAFGDVLWARAAGSSNNVDIGQQVAVDPMGDVYVAGEFSGDALFGSLPLQSTFDPQLQAPGTDVFVVKYSAAGNAIWVKKGAAPNADRALGLASDEGGCWLAGQFSGDITFDAPHANALNNAGFLVRFNGAGAEQWFRKLGGGASVVVGDLCATADTLWLAGSQSGNNLVFSSPPVPVASGYPYSAFALAFSESGAVLAQRTIGSDHVIEAKCIDARGPEVMLGGTFACQASELSEEAGGDGLFISWGASSGWIAALQRQSLVTDQAQMFACHDAMDLRGVVFGTLNRMFAVGEYAGSLYCPTQEGRMRAWPGDSLIVIGPEGLEVACDDTTYYDAARLQSRGVLDGFFLKGMIPERRPLDIFARDSCTFGFDAEFSVIAAPPINCQVPGSDAAFCGSGFLAAQFNFTFGPVPAISWNNGASGGGLEVQQPGAYTASAQVGPGCFSGSDGITIGICGSPWLPGITDDLGINVQDSATQLVVVCEPQTVTLTAGPVPGISFQWFQFPNTFIYDTSFVAPVDGVWSLQVFNDEGCSSSTEVQLVYTPNQQLGLALAQQAILFPQDTDGNDTINICSYESVVADLYADVTVDGVPLSGAMPFQAIDTVYAVPGGIVDQGAFDVGNQPKEVMAGYTSDGWYVFDFHLDVSDEPCLDHHANFNFRDSIYVLGAPSLLGQVDIVGSIFLCAGDSVTLTAQANGPGSFDWSADNGGIVGPTDGQSITIIQPGLVNVVFAPLETGTCVQGDVDEHSVAVVAPPTISMDPPSGLVCPGDAVTLTVGGVQGFYNWFGPGGPLPGFTNSISVTEAGTYFCVVDTYEGCTYATALQTVSLYGTPYLVVLPQPVICEGGSVQVTVQPAQNATFQWDAPLTGNTSTQTITSPGTYTCSVIQCGVQTDLSFTIAQAVVDVSILNEGPFGICPGDSVLLQAAPGLVAYAWQPGSHVGQDVYVTEEGSYAVIGFDTLGCTDTAFAAIVDVHAFDIPLSAWIDTACAGEQSVGTAIGSGAVNWYADTDTLQLIATGTNVLLGSFDSTTTVFATLTDAQCTSLPIPVEAVVVPTDVPIVISGDTTVCIGDALVLSASPGIDFQWTTPLGTYSGANVMVPSVGVDASGTWTVSASQSGCASGVASVEVVVPDPQVSVLDPGPFVLCASDSVLLQASPGLATYTWLPGELNGQNVFVDVAGSYTVIGMDEYGCTDTAGIALISGFVFTQPISAQGTTICAGDDAVLVATGSGMLTWFADPGAAQPIGTGSELNLADVSEDTTVFVSQFEEPCNSVPLPVTVDVLPLPPAPVINGDLLLCIGDQLLLNTSPVYPSYWSTPTGPVINWLVNVPFATAADSGTYSVYYVLNGCEGPTAEAAVVVSAEPTPQLGPDQLLCAGDVVPLDAGEGAVWVWSNGSLQQSVLINEAGTYWVEVVNAAGCAASDTITFTEGDCSLDEVNVFTPNGDGVNDVLTFTSPSRGPLVMQVFNRWGQLLCERNARIAQWDGRNCTSGEEMPEGVYFFTLRTVLPDGDALDKSGYVHLVR